VNIKGLPSTPKLWCVKNQNQNQNQNQIPQFIYSPHQQELSCNTSFIAAIKASATTLTSQALQSTSSKNGFLHRFPSTEFTPLFRLLDDYDTHRSTHSKASSSKSLRGTISHRNLTFEKWMTATTWMANFPELSKTTSRSSSPIPYPCYQRQDGTSFWDSAGSLADLDAEESAPSGASSPKSYQATVEDGNEDGDDTVISSGENALIAFRQGKHHGHERRIVSFEKFNSAIQVLGLRTLLWRV